MKTFEHNCAFAEAYASAWVDARPSLKPDDISLALRAVRAGYLQAVEDLQKEESERVTQEIAFKEGHQRMNECLRAEIATLKGEKEGLLRTFREQSEKLARMPEIALFEAENARLREALEFVASEGIDDGDAYSHDDPASVAIAMMNRARHALANARQASQASGTPEVAAGGNGPGQVTPGSGSNPHEVRQDQLGSSPSPAASTPVQEVCEHDWGNFKTRCKKCGKHMLDFAKDVKPSKTNEATAQESDE